MGSDGDGVLAHQESRFRLRTMEELERTSPSRADGVPAELEARMKRTAINLIIQAGAKLNMDTNAVGTGIVFLQRFYSIRSLLRNDRFLMSVACLYLAGKVEDCPKSARDVLCACYERRYRGHPEALRRCFHDKAYFESARERVFVAERALLYALGFDFTGLNTYHQCLSLLNNEMDAFVDALDAHDSMQLKSFSTFAMVLATDSHKTPLCLLHPARHIAAACIWLTVKMLKLDMHSGLGLEAGWWAPLGLTPAALDDISSHLLALYQPAGVDVVADPSYMLVSARLVPGAKAEALVAGKAAGTPEEKPAAEEKLAAAAAGHGSGGGVDELDEFLEELEGAS